MAALLGIVRPVFERLPRRWPASRDAGAGQPRPPARRAMAGPAAAGGRALASENEWRVAPGDSDGPAGVLASWLPRSEVTLAYPGLRLEDAPTRPTASTSTCTSPSRASSR